MPLKVWYDSTEKKVYYDSTEKKQLAKGVVCPYCEDPPWAIKAVPSGILCCPGEGNCCLGEIHYKILDQGIGWNVEALLEWGKWTKQGGIWVQSFPTNVCYWSELLHDDFGTFERYNLGGCQGGVEYTGHITTRHTYLQQAGQSWALVIDLFSDEEFPEAISFIYHHDENTDPGEVCVPYGTWANDWTCSGSRCTGNGTVELIEV